ncbi:MAG TPA: class I SAM-dependent methyltransferase [Chthoniobacterales bacterium]
MVVTPAITQVLHRLEALGQAHDRTETNHSRKLLNLERATAELLQVLVLSSRRRRILEIGTSNGYSAVWLAAALRAIPGAQPLLTIEQNPAKAQEARANLAAAGLREWANVVEGSATDTVKTLTDRFDCVFFDADRVSAAEQLQLLLPKLEPHLMLLADNALSHPAELAGYLLAVEALPDFITTTVPVGKGLHVAVRGPWQEPSDAYEPMA